MEYLINLGLAGLKRILENRGFTDSDKVKKALDEYEEDNNPILGFSKSARMKIFILKITRLILFIRGIKNTA